MDGEVREELDKLEARVAALESVLADIEDEQIDPIIKQHREFAAETRVRREAQK
jgi:BMFP domain-containing protein YqiC